MSRICIAYGITEYDLHSIASQIVITYRAPDGRHYTQSVRIGIPANNLGKLEQYNAIARRICREMPDIPEIEQMLASVPDSPYGRFARPADWLGYTIGAGGFCLFFGGSKTFADEVLETDQYGQQKIQDVEIILSPGKQILKGFFEKKYAVAALVVVVAKALVYQLVPRIVQADVPIVVLALVIMDALAMR